MSFLPATTPTSSPQALASPHPLLLSPWPVSLLHPLPAAVLCALDVPDQGVDYENHECRLGVTLPLRAAKLLMLEIVERVAATVMVRETKGIDKVSTRVLGRRGVQTGSVLGGSLGECKRGLQAAWMGA